MISNFSDDLGLVWFMLFKRIVFENTNNTILGLYKKCFCYLNLVFYLFFCVFLNKKKLRTKHVIFENIKQF